MTRLTRRTRWLATCACLVAVVGCTPGGGEEEPDVTPQQAAEQLRDLAEEVLAALAPDGDSRFGDPLEPIPCGGLEGTSFSKVKSELTGIAGRRVDDADAAFETARTTLTGRGLEVDPVIESGEGRLLDFRDEVVRGSLVLHPDGRMMLSAETACLDNPDEG